MFLGEEYVFWVGEYILVCTITQISGYVGHLIVSIHNSLVYPV